MKHFFIDPPDGWRHGFPRKVPEDVLNDPAQLEEFILATGYPAEQWKWAQRHLRVWAA